MAQMEQLHSLSSKCEEWRISKVTFLQWQLPLCCTSVSIIYCSFGRFVGSSKDILGLYESTQQIGVALGPIRRKPRHY